MLGYNRSSREEEEKAGRREGEGAKGRGKKFL